MRSGPVAQRAARFALGTFALGAAAMLWNYAWATDVWVRASVNLWLIVLFVAPTAIAAGLGFGVGLQLVGFGRYPPRSRVEDWWAMGLGALFFHALWTTFLSWRLLQNELHVGLLLVAALVTPAAAVIGLVFGLVFTRAIR